MNEILHIISLLSVLSGFLAALIILFHIFPHRRQPMKIMEAVWPLTGLWAGWLGLYAYLKTGKQNNGAEPMKNMDMRMPVRPRWQSAMLSTLHCGAGCTLADILGEWFTFFIPLSIKGSIIAGQWTLDYMLALVIGVFFQYAAIRPMSHLSGTRTLIKAFKIDFLSLTSWQIGMYSWMAIVIFVIHKGVPIAHNSWEFWFMMQIAMLFGFLTSYPVNRILIKTGIKQDM